MLNKVCHEITGSSAVKPYPACTFYQPERSAQMAGPKIALRFLCLFVCLFVCPHLSHVQYIMSYVTMQLQCIAAFGGLQAKLQQMKVVVCSLDGENLVGSHKDPVFCV